MHTGTHSAERPEAHMCKAFAMVQQVTGTPKHTAKARLQSASRLLNYCEEQGRVLTRIMSLGVMRTVVAPSSHKRDLGTFAFASR